MDTPKRSWMKSVTWRIVGVVILGGVTFLFTRDIGKTTWITLIFHSTRLILYYYHERIWERVQWGRLKHPLAHLPVRHDLTREEEKVIRRFLEEQRFTADATEYQI